MVKKIQKNYFTNENRLRYKLDKKLAFVWGHCQSTWAITCNYLVFQVEALQKMFQYNFPCKHCEPSVGIDGCRCICSSLQPFLLWAYPITAGRGQLFSYHFTPAGMIRLLTTNCPSLFISFLSFDIFLFICPQKF